MELIFVDNEPEYDDHGQIVIKTGTGAVLHRTPITYRPISVPFEPAYTPVGVPLELAVAREEQRISQESQLLNQVVYDNVDGRLYTLKSPNDNTLVFESRFESGNLRRATQICEFEYDLIMSPDYNTSGHTQWFYFSVANTKAGATYRFNLINFLKTDSSYNHGMKPCVYSRTDEAWGWYRAGSDIVYYQNNMKKRWAGYYHTLSFSLHSLHSDDVLSIAHCYPYTYSDLLRDLAGLVGKHDIVVRHPLCSTVAGNLCELLTITNFLSTSEEISSRKGVFLMARVHPGETNSSWMMKGLLECLTGPSATAVALRDRYVFRVVPMVNPDGVINGNCRCGLAGVDLNRCWLNPSPFLHPTIYHAKVAVQFLTQEREVVLSCDFHGHSKNRNIFMYGCISESKVPERVFPCLFAQYCEVFSYKDSSFALQKAKEGTARVVIFKNIGIGNSYTLESSFFGSDFGLYENKHFGIETLMKAGAQFCDCLLEFSSENSLKVRRITEELQTELANAVEENKELTEEHTEEESGDKKKLKRKKKTKKSKALS